MKNKLMNFAENCNKYTRGKTAIIGGSTGMTGAVCLASRAASRSGCGLVCAVVPEELNGIFEIKLTEEMSLPLNSENGSFKGDDTEKLFDMLAKCHSVATGMGAGKSNGYQKVLKWLLREYKGKLILDADALNIIAEKPYYLREGVVLTPHTGEFSRLTGKNSIEIENNREELAKKYAKENSAVVVLKGENTVVTDGERVYINKTGNKGMAKGGSGDVLSGIIASLCAQGMENYDAAVCGVYLHGLAGDIAEENYTDMSMTASDIIKHIPDAYKEILK